MIENHFYFVHSSNSNYLFIKEKFNLHHHQFQHSLLYCKATFTFLLFLFKTLGYDCKTLGYDCKTLGYDCKTLGYDCKTLG